MAQHVARSLLPSLCRRRAAVQWATPNAVAHSLRCFSSRPSGVIPHDQATGEALRDAVGAFAKAELEPHVLKACRCCVACRPARLPQLCYLCHNP